MKPTALREKMVQGEWLPEAVPSPRFKVMQARAKIRLAGCGTHPGQCAPLQAWNSFWTWRSRGPLYQMANTSTTNCSLTQSTRSLPAASTR